MLQDILTEDKTRQHILQYVVAFLVGLTVYMLLLYVNIWSPWLSFSSMVSFHMLSSGAIMLLRFLGGVGIAITYAAFCSFVLQTISPWLKNRRRRADLVKALLGVLGAVLLAYATYTLLMPIQGTRAANMFDTLGALFGIWSLMLLVYVVPIVRNHYNPLREEARIGQLRNRLKYATYSIWRGYSYYLRKEYGKIYSSEFRNYGEQLDNLRTILSGILLLPISLTLIAVTPLTTVSAALWRRMFSLQQAPFSRGERFLFVGIAIAVAIASTLFFLIPVLGGSVMYLDLSYGAGMLTGILLLLLIVTRR